MRKKWKNGCRCNSHSGKRCSAGQTALSFGIVNPAVSTVVSGIRTLAQPEDVMGVMDVPRLSEEEERELRGVLPVNVYGDHRR